MYEHMHIMYPVLIKLVWYDVCGGTCVLDGARIDEGTDSERKFGNLHELPH